MPLQLTECSAWRALREHREKMAGVQMRDMFARDAQRAQLFSLAFEELYLDYSKNRIDGRGLGLLFDLARERGVEQARERMFSGAAINNTERRAVLHTALRNRSGSAVVVDGADVMPQVEDVLRRLAVFSSEIREHRWRGHTGKPITDIVNIGIGGSHLGPQMVTDALRDYRHPGIASHFVANIDGADIVSTLQQVDPEQTLFIVASKSFTTQETMTNARTARDWFLGSGASQAAIANHFVAVSTNGAAVAEFGIDPGNMFGFWDWVGGRYSLWSAIGLPIILSVGYERFIELLEGAHAMDRHFRERPLEQNWPVVLGLLGVWYVNFHGAGSHAVIPYAQRLRWLPDYLQQADMESNGKRTTRDGDYVTYDTGPIIWGSPGTNGQHAYFQLLHQGTRLVPVDFIAVAHPGEALDRPHHAMLLANCLAQSEALLSGRSPEQTRDQLRAAGVSGSELEALTAHRSFPGNRPSNTIVLQRLDPRTLGSLIAMYEHKIFVQGVIWDINSFDQWGVELGKQLADGIVPELEHGPRDGRHPSTAALIDKIKGK